MTKKRVKKGGARRPSERPGSPEGSVRESGEQKSRDGVSGAKRRERRSSEAAKRPERGTTSEAAKRGTTSEAAKRQKRGDGVSGAKRRERAQGDGERDLAPLEDPDGQGVGGEETDAAPKPKPKTKKPPKPTRVPDLPNTFRVKVRRQDGPERVETRRWEQFEVPRAPRMNVISVLQYIQRHPITVDGTQVAPVAWECSCLEEVCGACTMVINGRVRQACSALVDELIGKGRPVVLEPMRKFPVVRDLVVDRSRMFETLKQIQAWIDIDGSHDLGPGPRQSQESQQERYALSRCMTCGSCLEACPQYGEHSEFVGASAINQVRLAISHPTGKLQKTGRIERLMAPGGVADCGKAQNCVEVCPAKIPLVDSLQHMSRETTKRFLFGWLLK